MRAYNRAYLIANRETLNEKRRERSQKADPVTKKIARQRADERTRTFRKLNPEKAKAHWTLTNGLRYGTIVKPEICPRCGTKKQIEGHHPDYSEPAVVEFLCKSCHMKQHRRIQPT